jgi:hypothetical protein
MNSFLLSSKNSLLLVFGETKKLHSFDVSDFFLMKHFETVIAFFVHIETPLGLYLSKNNG